MAYLIASITLVATGNTLSRPPQLLCENATPDSAEYAHICQEIIREGEIFELVLDDNFERSIWCVDHRDERSD